MHRSEKNIKCFDRLKSGSDIEAQYDSSADVHQEAYLNPLVAIHLCDYFLIKSVCDWLNINIQNYSIQDQATFDITRSRIEYQILGSKLK